MRGTEMQIYLDDLSKSYKDYHMALVMDGAPCHQEGCLQVPDNITIIKIPPYSPELNPSERLWSYIRTNFLANKQFSSIEKLMDDLEIALRYMAKDTKTIKSACNYHWIGNY